VLCLSYSLTYRNRRNIRYDNTCKGGYCYEDRALLKLCISCIRINAISLTHRYLILIRLAQPRLPVLGTNVPSISISLWNYCIAVTITLTSAICVYNATVETELITRHYYYYYSHFIATKTILFRCWTDVYILVKIL